MHRLRISGFQVALLRLIRDSKYGCAPGSPNFKRALFGKLGGLWTVQRDPLRRSLRRLVENRMISDNGFGWCRLTQQGQAWLRARDTPARPKRPRGGRGKGG
jgi:hypothetical protein